MRIAVVSAVLFFWSVAAFAAGTPPSALPNPQATHHGPPCVADAQRFCSKVPYGDGRRLECLIHHNAQLAPACREQVGRLRPMYEYGQKQKKATEALLAKQKNAPARKTGAPPPASPATPK